MSVVKWNDALMDMNTGMQSRTEYSVLSGHLPGTISLSLSLFPSFPVISHAAFRTRPYRAGSEDVCFYSSESLSHDYFPLYPSSLSSG